MEESLFHFYKSAENNQGSAGGERAIKLAACAVLLEMARYVEGFSNKERAEIARALRRSYGLSNELAMQLMRSGERLWKDKKDHWRFCPAQRETHALMSKRTARAQDHWGLTLMVDKAYSKEEKLKIFEVIWRMILANETFTERGKNLLTKEIAYLLRVSYYEILTMKVRLS